MVFFFFGVSHLTLTSESFKHKNELNSKIEPMLLLRVELAKTTKTVSFGTLKRLRYAKLHYEVLKPNLKA